tara:strand:- start:5240 stop:5719 length:480 start_codon:yes stop_codon:yes gene_type:complete
MNIKNLKPQKNGRTKQGYFKVTESVKYVGAVKKVIYRSSWEERFCIFCERNPIVSKWSSESITIKYHCPIDNRIKNYYPDFLVKLANGKTWLVEVKPAQEYKKPPAKPKRKTKKALSSYEYLMKNYVVNMSKFKSARAYCESKGWEFFIADETWFKKRR